ncbi:JK_15P [Escherichia phage Jk06]|uniref:JK_15P n=1 Tax=Escherichia phage Jk06 TaxID=2886922 RepID=Q45Q01_9CAUD|nr:hypothetical protein JK_15 [Escherichia phage Jk06]AAZ29265.1 JK_15P [Escherichia phage Jk06]
MPASCHHRSVTPLAPHLRNRNAAFQWLQVRRPLALFDTVDILRALDLCALARQSLHVSISQCQNGCGEQRYQLFDVLVVKFFFKVPAAANLFNKVKILKAFGLEYFLNLLSLTVLGIEDNLSFLAVDHLELNRKLEIRERA